MTSLTMLEPKQKAAGNIPISAHTTFGYARDFLDNRFVYLVVSPRDGYPYADYAGAVGAPGERLDVIDQRVARVDIDARFLVCQRRVVVLQAGLIRGR